MRCDWAVGGAVCEGGGCLQDGTGAEGGDGGCGAVVVEEVAVGGSPEHGGGG